VHHHEQENLENETDRRSSKGITGEREESADLKARPSGNHGISVVRLGSAERVHKDAGSDSNRGPNGQCDRDRRRVQR
jgi:hypothetical protein